jgi:uncharacterized protein YbaR (Trm112 family)
MMTDVAQRDVSALLDLLACPGCRSHPLIVQTGALGCSACGREFEVVDGVPVLLLQDLSAAVEEHQEQDRSAPEVTEWPSSPEGPGLTLGVRKCGAPSGWIQVDDHISDTTDVVADIHRLPFQDASFGAIVSCQGLEHSPEPTAATGELYRVLRAGGQLLLQTAFIQPFGVDHAHHYHATEYGARRWLSTFQVDACTVPEAMNPALALARLFTEVLDQVARAEGPALADLMARTTLAQWREMWADPGARRGLAWELMKRLPPEVEKRFAPTLQLDATKAR